MAPRTKKQLQEIREEKRTLIMDVGLEHFARDGYHNTTISHLAKHAGISKGLMYNYFASKEELLAAIVSKSLSEISAFFDPDKDGILSPDELELFVRKYFQVIREKVVFWRLFFQLMLQKDVREHLLGERKYSGSDHRTFKGDIIRIIREYFLREYAGRADTDPLVEMNMFLFTLEGLALTIINTDTIDDTIYEKTINRIIEVYR